MTLLGRVGFLLLILMVPMSASGARFPNAVEKTVVLTGEAAVLGAELLGLSAQTPSSPPLRLGRGEAWAVYLLKQDTKEPLYNDNDGSPPRYNQATYVAAPVPTLTLGPFWLDRGTKLPDPKPGEFSFGSPFLPAALDGSDPWTRIVRRLQQERGWTTGAYPEIQRCAGPPDGPSLCVVVYGVKDYTNNIEQNGYTVGFVLHQR
jgi:hypothetical protein